MRTLPLAVAMAAVFASTSMASIVGSTYAFSASSTGNTAISATNGTYTDPSNPGFCVGSNVIPPDCGGGSGVSGGFQFAHVNPTLDTITFTFAGTTAGAGPGTFVIDLGNFAPIDGETITGVTYASGNFFEGDFSNVSWNGTDATFTGSTSGDFDAFGGVSVVFNVTTTSAVPEPGSIILLFTGIGLLAATKRLRRGVSSTEA